MATNGPLGLHPARFKLVPAVDEKPNSVDWCSDWTGSTPFVDPEYHAHGKEMAIGFGRSGDFGRGRLGSQSLWWSRSTGFDRSAEVTAISIAILVGHIANDQGTLFVWSRAGAIPMELLVIQAS